MSHPNCVKCDNYGLGMCCQLVDTNTSVKTLSVAAQRVYALIQATSAGPVPRMDMVSADQSAIDHLNRAGLTKKTEHKYVENLWDKPITRTTVAHRVVAPKDAKPFFKDVLSAMQAPLSAKALLDHFKPKPWAQADCLRLLLAYAEVHGLINVIKKSNKTSHQLSPTGHAFLAQGETQ